MESQTIEFEGSGGVTLIADAWGDPDADPILFMHGGGQTRHSWGGAAELLAGKGWRTLASISAATAIAAGPPTATMKPSISWPTSTPC